MTSDAFAREWVQVWNRRDLESLLSCYAEDVEFRSPLAAKNVATTRMDTSARNAIGSRSDNRGIGQPALILRADRSARSTCACQRACATGSLPFAAM